MEYIRILVNQDLPEVKVLKPFKCIVIIEEDVSRDWHNKTSKWLVDSGCMYMMAWGTECGLFHDYVDETCVSKLVDEKVDINVVTTWHDDEPLDEVFHYSKYYALKDIDDNELKNTVILHISEIDKEAEFRKLMEEV